MIRTTKIALAVFVALFCLMYAAQNLMNLGAAQGFVGLMTSMTGHEAYPRHFGPPITAAGLVWLMLAIIIALELLAGLLAAKGAIDMWRARKAVASEFNESKRYAILACGVAVIIWYGIFSAIGGAYFQMWQTEAGEGPLMHASTFSIQHGLLLLILALKDD